jgi:CubicO group peptidase (beta-lactamase class C family)
VDTTPGDLFRYSGGGTTVMQLVLSDVTGTPFPELARRLVLEPAGMLHSTYEQPPPPPVAARTAAAHGQDGAPVAGRWHVYPELAAAGLWTTPTDLLRWAIAIADARAGRPGALLSPETAREMLTVQKGTVGLGPFLNGADSAFSFGHGGANRGFRSQLIYFPETGQGAAVMANADNGGTVIQEILYAIAAEFGWPGYGPTEVTALALDGAALVPYAGTYAASQPVPVRVEITLEDGRLFLEVLGFEARGPLVLTSPTEGVSVESGTRFRFEIDAAGRVRSVGAGGIRAVRTP